MKRLLTLSTFLLLSIMTFASTLIDGIYYEFSGTEATVVSGANKYAGDVIIPAKIVDEQTYTVKSIGEYAFSECPELTSVTIPNSVTSIGGDAFKNCSGLTSITIGGNVTSIGGGTFSGCSGLTSITIPNSVETIENKTFADCSSLTSVTIGENVTSIGNNAFKNCNKLTYIYIPNKVTSIDAYAFYGCSGLNSVTIGNNVTNIGESAFQDCWGLTYVTIPKSVKSIGHRAFLYCNNITSIYCNIESPSNIGEIFEKSYYSNVTLYVPYGTRDEYLRKDGWRYFTNIKENLYYTFSGTKATVVKGKNAYTGDVIIPESVTYDGKTYIVTRFEGINSYSPFKGCTELNSVIIPNSVEYMGSEAFKDCTGLTSVTIGNSVKNIEDRTFQNCSALTSVTIPNSVTNIGPSAFEGCSSLTSITIPNSVTSIGSGAFYKCSALTNVTIGNSVTSIGGSAFEYCSGLTSVNIPNSVVNLGPSAFYRCSALTNVTIGNSVTSIKGETFIGCSALTDVVIGNSVASIGNNAFYLCPKLESIIVQEGNTTYDSRENCNAIIETSSNTLILGCKNTTIPNSVTNIGSYAFYNCPGLTSMAIPNSVTSIGENAFLSCSALTNVTIGNSVTSIGGNAFRECSTLTSITIPNSLTSIDYGAFEGCTALTSIYSYIENPKSDIGSDFYSSNYTNATLYVPYGTKDKYLATYGWKKFTNIVEMEPQPTASGTCGENLTWAYYEVDKELVISGTGAMDDYDADTSAPWDSYKDNIKKVIIEEGVTSIGKRVFANFSNLISITIPNSTTLIGDYAFVNCIRLTSITIPNSVTSIGFSAFNGCRSLTSINIPNSLSHIEGYTFNWCDKLSSISIPSSVTNIGEMAFFCCKGLTSVTIPNSVTSIGYGAFGGCSGLTSIDIPNSVISIGSGAFSGCSNLSTITIPNSVMHIDDDILDYTAWYENQPDGMVYLGNYAYKYKGDMPANTSINIKDGTLGICGSAFKSCANLISVNIPNSVKFIDYHAFQYCTSLTSINIPNSVNIIGDQGFFGCSGLSTLDIPKGVTSIGHSAFGECSGITSITIPNSVTEIMYNAFENCLNLTSIYSHIENPVNNVGSYYFDSSNYTNATLYVPKGTIDKYLATDGWKDFVNIEEMSEHYSTDNTLAISNAETYVGKQVVLPIDMNNVASIQAFQFDLYLPEGITVAKDEDEEYLIDLTSRAAKSHSISAQTRPDGAIRMVCTSMAGAAFKGNEGTIVNVTLSVAPDMTAGNYEIKIKNIELSDGTPYNPADIKATLTVKAYTPGDVDGTGTVSVNDAVCIINYILGSPIEGFIEAAADLDGNGVITVNDVVILINDYILGGNSQNSLDLAFLEDVTADDDYLFINDITMKAGETTEVEVFMNTNRNDIQGLQCDIYLPDGMEFVPEEDGDEKYYADKGGRAAKSHSVAAQLMADGSVRVVETSTSGAKFKDNDQAVFYFTVKAKEDMVAGNYEIKLANMELSYGGTPINPSDRTAKVVITDPSAINGVNAEDAKSFVGKFIKDNKIIIMKNGKKHAVSGQGM